MNYKILGSDWYTPPVVDVLYDAVTGITENLSVGIVAIESNETHWKAYLGYGVFGDQTRDEQRIASNGVKVTKAVACATFPDLDPEGFTY